MNHEEAYAGYIKDPSKENLSQVVKSLNRTVNYSLASLNSSNNPVMKSKALVYTANAVKNYDPDSGAALPTYVTTQLQRLIRDNREVNAPVRIADRTQLDAYKIDQSEKEFEERHGREPDLLELADFTGIPVKRIEKVNKQMMAMPSESALADVALHESSPDFYAEALDVVYHESDHVDRKIIEHKLGYGGKPTLNLQDMSMSLKVSPSQISRRAKRISKKLNDLVDFSDDVYS
jgi:DNA-directed RNA polymerase specialized sigma subunit